MEEVSKQSHIQAATWALLGYFSQCYTEKQEQMSQLNNFKNSEFEQKGSSDNVGASKMEHRRAWMLKRLAIKKKSTTGQWKRKLESITGSRIPLFKGSKLGRWSTTFRREPVKRFPRMSAMYEMRIDFPGFSSPISMISARRSFSNHQQDTKKLLLTRY